jgi:hypothetical protein
MINENEPYGQFCNIDSDDDDDDYVCHWKYKKGIPNENYNTKYNKYKQPAQIQLKSVTYQLFVAAIIVILYIVFILYFMI